MTNYVKQQVELITEGRCDVKVNERISHDLKYPTKIMTIQTITISNWDKVGTTERILLDLNFRGCNTKVENNTCTITKKSLRDDNHLKDLTQKVINNLV